MLTTILIEYPWLTTVALVVLLVAGPLAGRLLVRRPRVAWSLAALAVVPVVALTLVPTGYEPYPGCYVDWSLPTLGRVERMANLLLFAPPVLLAGVASRRPLRWLLVGIVASAAIETLQSVVPAIGRSCDTGDWLANGLGATLGAVLAGLALWSRRADAGRAAGTR